MKRSFPLVGDWSLFIQVCRCVSLEFSPACDTKTPYSYQKCHESGLILIGTLASRVARSVVEQFSTISKAVKDALENTKYPPTAAVLLCHIMEILVGSPRHQLWYCITRTLYDQRQLWLSSLIGSPRSWRCRSFAVRSSWVVRNFNKPMLTSMWRN